MEMPFGKHQGEEVEDLPDDYLKWLRREVAFFSRNLSETYRRPAFAPLC